MLSHRPLQIKRVDPARALQRVAQAVCRLQIEGQGDAAELQVEVDKRHSAAATIGDRPGDAGRDHRCANAAPGTHRRDQAA